MTSKEYREAKKAALGRRRRVIFNNDGCDATPFGGVIDRPADFLAARTAPLAGSQVDAIAYCRFIDFGSFIREREEGRVGGKTDPLAVTVDFCRRRGLEIFWSMRMNDTHDATFHDRFRANRFKAENPGCLMGSRENKPRLSSAWSAADYGCEKVRETAYRTFEGVCLGYDIDGVEMDFFRHPVFFRRVAAGLPAGKGERELMTGLIARFAAFLEEAGRRRGKPYLLAARVPDDPDYGASIGLEVEEWLARGLVDILVPGGNFRLNRWQESVALGRRHGVKVYPSLHESMVGGRHHADPVRASDECYRARALNAWNAGADGIHLFNIFDPGRKIWSEIGDPEILRSRDRVYLSSVRGTGFFHGRRAYPHAHFGNLPTLNPDEPVPLGPGGRRAFRIEIGEEIRPAGKKEMPEIRLRLHLRPDAGEGRDITVALNANDLGRGRVVGEVLEFPVPAGFLRAGMNTVEAWYRGEREGLAVADAMVLCDHSGDCLAGGEARIARTREMMKVAGPGSPGLPVKGKAAAGRGKS